MNDFVNYFELGEKYKHIALHADALLALAADSNAEIKVVDIQGKSIRRALKGNDSEVVQAKFSLNGRRAFTVSANKTVSLWSLDDGEANGSITLMPEKVVAVEFSNDGERLAVLYEGGMGSIYSSHDCSAIGEFKISPGEICGAGLTAVFMGGDDLIVGVLEGNQKFHRPTLRLFYPNRGTYRSIDLSTSPRRFGEDSKPKTPSVSHDSHERYGVIGFNRNCSHLALFGTSLFRGMGGIGDVNLIDTQTGEWVLELEPGVGRRWNGAFSADGNLLVVTDHANVPEQFFVYDVVTGRKLHHGKTKSYGHDEVGVTSGGRYLVSAFTGMLNSGTSNFGYGLRYSTVALP